MRCVVISLVVYSLRGQMKPFEWFPWTRTTTCNVITVRTVIWSWMTRRVTAAILWTDTCCVTGVTSNTWTLPPRCLQLTATTVSFKHLPPPSGCSETSTFAKDAQISPHQKSQLSLRSQTVWDTLLNMYYVWIIYRTVFFSLHLLICY